jgi:hypothetical protein
LPGHSRKEDIPCVSPQTVSLWSEGIFISTIVGSLWAISLTASIIWKTYLRCIFLSFLNLSIMSSMNSFVISLSSRTPSYSFSTTICSKSSPSAALASSGTSIALRNASRLMTFWHSSSRSFAVLSVGNLARYVFQSRRASRCRRMAVFAAARLHNACHMKFSTFLSQYDARMLQTFAFDGSISRAFDASIIAEPYASKRMFA